MLFLVHDERGQITQSNKHYDHEGYDKVLADAGLKFIAIDSPKVLMPDDYYVKNGALRERQRMPVRIDRQIMKANKTGVTLSNVPKPCRMTVSVGDLAVHTETIVDGAAYLESPVPGTYKILLDAWPYLPWTIQIECVP
jgi:hypothetical protein